MSYIVFAIFWALWVDIYFRYQNIKAAKYILWISAVAAVAGLVIAQL